MEESEFFNLQCKSQRIFEDQTQIENIISIWPITDVLSYIRGGS